MLKIYGLKNCDTCRAARKWLTAQSIPHEFHDVREISLDEATLTHWLTEVGLDTLLNKRGTTWRKLKEAEKAPLDTQKAVQLMVAHPALIKRPIFSKNSKISVGFPKDENARMKMF